MEPSIASGEKVVKVPSRGATEIHVRSVDDTRNVLGLLDYEDRFSIVFAAGAVMDRFVPETDEPALRRDFFSWVGLTMLLELVARTEARWGEGPPGLAKPASPRGPESGDEVRIQRMPRRVRKARLPENLLLNMVRADLVLPPFRDANYPLAIRRVRDELFAEYFSRGVFVPSRRLAVDIVMELRRLGGLPHGPEDAKQVHEMVASQRTFAVPGVKASVSARVLPLVLEYYGVATPARTASCSGYRVRPWLLQRLMGMWTDHRVIRLSELTWMQGRYFVDGVPVDCATGDAAEHKHL